MIRRNLLKENFLAKLPTYLIENVRNKFSQNINFNFQFFDNSQPDGQDFKDWNHEQLYKLLDKLKEYCKNTLQYWQTMRIGKGSKTVLEIYDRFPVKSDFHHPKHVPLDVAWARFRLESDMRLVGFVVNKETCRQLAIHPNIFYVVFLDRNHKFCKK